MNLKRKTVFEVQTPAWVFDPTVLAKNIRAFDRAMRDSGINGCIAYSVKTNSAPEVLAVVLESGVMAEVVSYDEWKLAGICGFPASRIIYNGPMKSRETFREAVSGGAIVNIECKRELDWLEDLICDPEIADKPLRVGVRVNINVSRVSPSDAENADDNSRFGFSEESGELAQVISRIKAMHGVILAGLHLHRTTHSRKVSFYRATAALAVELISRYRLEDELEFIDVGGGFYEMEPGKPTFGHYMRAISSVLGDYGGKFKIIAEPGNALVANAFSYVCEVIDVKQVDEEMHFVTTDASRKDLDPFFRRNDYVRDVHNRDRETSRYIVSKQVISGCTCIEQDRIFCLENSPEVKAGDRIVFRNVGAYTLTLSPQFIRYTPSVYLIEAGRLALSRPPMTADRLLASFHVDGVD